MDAISASGNGFDAALQALEDLEVSVAPTGDEKLAAKVIGGIAFSDDDEDEESQPVAIAALPIEEIELIVPDFAEEVRAERAASQAAPVAPAPTPAVPAPAPAPGRMVKFAVGLGLVSSLISAAGLVVAERTIMSAQLVVADARERAEQLAKANVLIRDLEIVRTRQVELLQAQQAQLASTPVTSAELQRRMDGLQAGLLARDPLNNVVTAIRAGQVETNARFNEFGLKMARIEAALEHR